MDAWVAAKVAVNVSITLTAGFWRHTNLLAGVKGKSEMNCEVVADSPYLPRDDRLTCKTHRKQVVRQPYMNETNWQSKKLEFLGDHPGGSIRVEE